MTEPEKTGSSEATEHGGAASEHVHVPADDLFRALSKPPRRRVLSYLIETPETTVEELADVLAGWHATESGLVGPTDRERIAVVLRHVHLPLLAEMEFVWFDADEGTAVRRDLSDPVRDAIESALEYERVQSSPEGDRER